MGSEDQALTSHTKKFSLRTTIIPKVSILTRKISLEDIEKIYLNSDTIPVMRKDTLPKIVPEIEVSPTRRRTSKENIMLILQRMMNLPGRELKKKVKILQVMKSMF